MKKLALGLWLIAEIASAQFRPMRFRRDGAAGITVVTSVDINDSGGTDITGSPCLGGNCAFTLPAGAAGGAPTTSTYITQVADAGLSAEQAMGSLGTGLVLNTTTTGVQSIYAGVTCTNQFVRVLSASGAATCASIANADITNTTIDLTTKVTGLLPLANIANIATARILGRTTASSGVIEELTATAPVTLSGGAVSVAVTPTNPGGAVALQAATPGTQQTGSANLSGTAIAGVFEAPSAGCFQWTALTKLCATVDGRMVGSKASTDSTFQLLSATTTSGSGVSLGASGVVTAIDGGQGAGTFASGGVRWTPVAKVGTYTAALDDSVIKCDASGGAFVVTLPTQASNGQMYGFVKTDSSTNTCTLTRAGSNTINGNISIVLNNQYDYVYITDSGPSGLWTVVSSNITYGPSGEELVRGVATELLTLSTGAATTDTTANLLPANSIIDAVVWRVTSSLDGGKTLQFGDPTTASRFSAAAQAGTSGSTGVGLAHMFGVVTTTAAGPTQAADAKVRVTASATPSSGIVRITVFYRKFVPPTS